MKWFSLLALYWIHNVYTSISPSQRYEQKEVYTTSRNKEFENEVIICNKQKCSVKCNHLQSCSGAQIFAFDNQELFVECNGEHSCDHLQINAFTASSMNLFCNNAMNNGSCFGSKIYCPSNQANQCNIAGSCNDINIFIANWNFAANYLNLSQCNPVNNIDNIKISCKDKYTQSELFYNSENKQIECKYSNERYCCPFRTSSNCSNTHTNDTTTNTCIYSCDFTHESDGCSYRLLESNNNSTDLIVNCSKYWSCQNTIVSCPLNAGCKFICTVHESCSNVQIISHSDSNNLDIICKDTGGGYDVCSSLSVYAPHINDLNIECEGCHDINILAPYIKNTLNIIFKPYCSRNFISAEYANHVNIESFGRFANYDSVHIFANFSKTLQIGCYAYYSQTNKHIHSSNTSCNHVSIYRYTNTNVESKTKLKCESFGCGNLYINSLKGLDDYDIDYNGCNSCHDLNQCFKSEDINWKISCFDPSMLSITTQIFDGNSCYNQNENVSTSNPICCGSFTNNNFTNSVEQCIDLTESPLPQTKKEL